MQAVMVCLEGDDTAMVKFQRIGRTKLKFRLSLLGNTADQLRILDYLPADFRPG
ncbi:MAG: hypothetical protein NTY37_03945 [Methanothrix sp.]|nr:hypothetical protein [Methanothrix sp.]